MMLVIVLLGLLIALAMPTIAGMRERARDATSLANLRSHAQILSVYLGDWDDTYPFPTDPTADLTILRGGGITIAVPFFHVSGVWPVPLADGYYDSVFPHPSILRPGEESLITSYHYSPTFITDPQFWNLETRTGPAQWGPVGGHQPVFPSAKAISVEFSTSRGVPVFAPSQQETPAFTGAFCDGSASAHPRGSSTPPVSTGEGDYDASLHRVGIVGMHTVNGVRGRDIR
ncbi:MAG: hypothetical protein R3B57_04320 [Phycisphaerales bacterium]